MVFVLVINLRLTTSCRVPLAIVNKAHQANQTYPFAISLIESVRAYERTLEKVRDVAYRHPFYLHTQLFPFRVRCSNRSFRFCLRTRVALVYIFCGRTRTQAHAHIHPTPATHPSHEHHRSTDKTIQNFHTQYISLKRLFHAAIQ